MISELEAAYTQAVERAGASTVSISVVGAFRGPPFRPYPRRGLGSGVVMHREGRILTNAHTVDGADRILVGLGDGRVLGGSVLGTPDEHPHGGHEVSRARAASRLRRRGPAARHAEPFTQQGMVPSTTAETHFG